MIDLQAASAERPGMGPGLSRLIGSLLLMSLAGCHHLSPPGDEEHVLPTVTVDTGDVVPLVVESGVLESADDSLIRCQVQSFLALPSSRPLEQTQGRVARAPRSSVAPVGLPGPSPRGLIAPKRSKTTARPKTSPGVQPIPGANLTQTLPKIRSFDYVVEPHRLLRAGAADVGPRPGPPPRPPFIISILPEGTRVREGEVVCELDSSSFRTELLIQKVRYTRAKAWVEQANSALEVNELAAKAYEEGIFPQDLQLIRQFQNICTTEAARAERALAWSSVASQQGLISTSRADADRLALQEAEIKLRLARGMERRLVNHTAKRILKAHQSKIEATRADRLSLEYSFQLESERLRRIETMIERCTLRAPSDGLVVYANKSNSWGRVETQIQKGLTVYETQPIFRILDPKRLKLKARINESLVSRVKEGMPALIRLDAFPERRLHGSVAEITPIPSPVNGGFSDVRAYFATVQIDATQFDDLRCGLSGEVEFLLDSKKSVPRVPVEALRWIGRQAFAALVKPNSDEATCHWQPVTLGESDARFAEVVNGLRPGDSLFAHPELLPPPEPKLRKPVEISLAHVLDPLAE